MPGLQSVDRVVAPQQGVSIALLDVVVGEFLYRVPFIVLRKFLDHGARQRCEIARCGDVVFGRQARRIAKMTGVHTQRRGMLIHHFGKHAFAAPDVFGQCNACVIARLHDHAHDKIFDRYSRADFDEHA